VAPSRRYLEYLRISYQVALLQPYRRNLTSAVVKSPKLYWMDLGLLRQATGQWGELDGALFETLLVSEVKKWVDTSGRGAALSFYRTRSGLEVDLLVQTPAGVLGLEAKRRERAHPTDARALRAVAAALGDEWLGGLVVYGGRRLCRLDEARQIWAVPVHRLL